MTNQSEPASVSSTRWWDLIAILLLISVVLTTSARLVVTSWADGLIVTMDFAFLGVVLGLVLGLSRFTPRMTTLLATTYGLFIIPWRLALMWGSGKYWDERLSSLIARIDVILNQIAYGKDVADSLLFIFLMSILFWVLSVNAGYVLIRYAHPWRVILPSGLTIFVIHFYHNCPGGSRINQCLNQDYRGGSWYIAFFLLVALSLIARQTHLHQIQRWQRDRAYVHSDVNLDLLRYTVVIVLIVLSLAWTIPTLGKTFSPASPLWQEFNRPLAKVGKMFKHIFASLRPTVSIVPDYYGAMLELGRGQVLSDTPVLQVVAPAPASWGAPYYWRARVFDQYQNGGWISNYSTVSQFLPSNLNPLGSENQGRLTATFAYNPYKHISTLYIASQPLWVDRPVDVELTDYSSILGSGSGEADTTVSDQLLDVMMLRAVNTVYPGEEYRARSSLSSVTVAELREAGTDYPQWLLYRYLQLPDNITFRTRQLAKEIAVGLYTPYDIAEAVTQYLRKNIEYAPTIITPPSDQELVDWFLFDYRQGFCNYYATAEIVLLRSLGIPARLAVGYAQGEHRPSRPITGPPEYGNIYNTGPEIYTVRERDAHAWPEIYFPEIGWVEFEPTASLLEIQRPSGDEVSPAVVLTPNPRPIRTPQMEPETAPTPEGNTANIVRKNNKIWLFLLYGVLVIIGLLVLGLIFWRERLSRFLETLLLRLGLQPPSYLHRWANLESYEPLPVKIEKLLRRMNISPPAFIRRWAHYAQLTPAERAYLEINRALRRLGVPPALDATPAERGISLVRALPQVEDPVDNLLTEYQRGAYSLHPANSDIAQRAGVEIRKLSFLAVLARWLERLQESPRAGSAKRLRKAD